VAAGVRVTNSDIDAVVSSDSGGGYSDTTQLDLCAGFELAVDVDQIETTWQLKRLIDIARIELGDYAQIDDDLVRIDSIDIDTGIGTVGRGVLDTEPRNHSAGAYLTAWENNNGMDPNEYDSPDTINIKIRPTTGKGTLPIGSASALPITMDERAIRPYPPGNFEVDGIPYPIDVISENFTVTWNHRDRLIEVVPPLVDHAYDGDIGPENGTEYDINILDDTNSVVLSYHDINGTSETINITTLDDGQYTLQLSSMRDALESFQFVEWGFEISV
jgi:hypothetical protein